MYVMMASLLRTECSENIFSSLAGLRWKSSALFHYATGRRAVATEAPLTKPEKTADGNAKCPSPIRLNVAKDGLTVRSPYPDIALPEATKTVADFVLSDAKSFPKSSQTALVDCEGRISLTYADLYDMKSAFSRALAKHGINQGDTVLLYLHNCPEFAVCLYGCLDAGVQISPCNHAYGEDELAAQICRIKPKLVVTHVTGLRTVERAQEKGQSHSEILIADLHSEERRDTLGLCLANRVSFMGSFLANGHAYCQGSGEDIGPFNNAASTAILPFTSGTSGQPKPIALSHRNMIANMCQQVNTPNKDIMNHDGYHADGYSEATIGVMPFFHIYGMVVTLGSALLQGAKVVTMDKFRPREFLSSCERHRITQLHFVPPLAQFIAQDQRVSDYDLSSVRSVFCGAAPMGEELARQASRRLNNAIVRQGYGMTETSPLTHACPLNNNKYGSVGVPLPNTEVRVVGTHTGTLLGANQQGEIHVRGPQVMQGYMRADGRLDPGVDSDGFLPTGDLGYYCDQGYFYIVDRLKEMMKVKGYQVAPAELESLLIQHEEVKDVGVTSIPDTCRGELPVAFIVACSKHSRLTESALQAYISKRVANHKQLTGGVVFVDEIPKTLSGKILRRQLKLQAAGALSAI